MLFISRSVSAGGSINHQAAFENVYVESETHSNLLMLTMARKMLGIIILLKQDICGYRGPLREFLGIIGFEWNECTQTCLYFMACCTEETEDKR